LFGHTCDRDRFAEFLPQLFASFNYYSYLCPIKIKDMEDKRYPTIDEEESVGKVSEPIGAVSYAEDVIDDIDYDFGGVDFGYAKSAEELREALARIDATRNDQNRWGTFSEMMSDFRKEHSEWFR
jgi:hypothetical protein